MPIGNRNPPVLSIINNSDPGLNVILVAEDIVVSFTVSPSYLIAPDPLALKSKSLLLSVVVM